MRTTALFGAKPQIFQNEWCVHMSKGGATADKGEGLIFGDFVRTSFMDGSLW